MTQEEMGATTHGSQDVLGTRGDGIGETTLDPTLLVELVSLLQRCPKQGRARLVGAAMTFLGESSPAIVRDGGEMGGVRSPQGDAGTPSVSQLHRRASNWLSQSGISDEDLEQIVHIDGKNIELIAHNVPGDSTKERVRSCYLVCGVLALLRTGEARFTDEEGRALCRDLTCYDMANHATSVKAIGSLLLGSKTSGYQLTAPGLKAAAEVLKQMKGLS